MREEMNVLVKKLNMGDCWQAMRQKGYKVEMDVYSEI